MISPLRHPCSSMYMHKQTLFSDLLSASSSVDRLTRPSILPWTWAQSSFGYFVFNALIGKKRNKHKENHKFLTYGGSISQKLLMLHYSITSLNNFFLSYMYQQPSLLLLNNNDASTHQKEYQVLDYVLFQIPTDGHYQTGSRPRCHQNH